MLLALDPLDADLERRRTMARIGENIELTSALAKCTSFLALRSSTAVSSEWPSIIDERNNNPAAQTDADRRPAVGTSETGQPTMVFDGSDVVPWPLIANNNATTKLGYAFWYRPGTISGTQGLIICRDGAGGASARKLDFFANGTAVSCDAYISGLNGRQGTTGNSKIAAGAWTFLRMAYDSSLGGDANIKIYVNGTSESLSYANLGAGGTLTTLPVVTGNILIGGFADTDAGLVPIQNPGEIGPYIAVLNADLTAAEEAALMLFLRPKL